MAITSIALTVRSELLVSTWSERSIDVMSTRRKIAFKMIQRHFCTSMSWFLAVRSSLFDQIMLLNLGTSMLSQSFGFKNVVRRVFNFSAGSFVFHKLRIILASSGFISPQHHLQQIFLPESVGEASQLLSIQIYYQLLLILVCPC